MTTLISPDGREYHASNVLEIKRLTAGFGYTVKPEEGKTAFDPDEHNVKDVVKYIGDHPDDAERVLDAERNGQARSTILGD